MAKSVQGLANDMENEGTGPKICIEIFEGDFI